MAARESIFKLNDKTVAIIGGYSSMTQMMMTLLTEQGADVALIGTDRPEARRVCDHINDQREIYPHYGRCATLSSPLTEVREAKDIISRVVHSFHRLDVLIDTLPCDHSNLELSNAILDQALPFLTSRPRSRVIWISHHSKISGLTAEFNARQNALAAEYASKNLTLNEVRLGISEEFLLKKFPKSSAIKSAFDEAKKQWPNAKLLDPYDIAATTLFLASPLSQALNNQCFYVDHGLADLRE